jgi:hypothetical protein
MDCDHSKLKGTVFGINDWRSYIQDQAAKYRKLVEQADDPFIKTELLALASVCDEIADNIEEHLTGGEDLRRVARCQGCHERGGQLRRLVATPSSTVLFSTMHYWPECLRGQAATYRKLAEETDDPVVKKTCLS